MHAFALLASQDDPAVPLPVCSLAQWRFQHTPEVSGWALGTTLGRARSLRWLLVPAGSRPRRQLAAHPTLTQSVRLHHSETRASPAGIPKAALMRSSGTVSMLLQAAGPVAEQPHRLCLFYCSDEEEQGSLASRLLRPMRRGAQKMKVSSPFPACRRILCDLLPLAFPPVLPLVVDFPKQQSLHTCWCAETAGEARRGCRRRRRRRRWRRLKSRRGLH